MKKRQKHGFTVVELVIVIALIALLSAVLVPVFGRVVENANRTNDIHLITNLNLSVSMELQLQNKPEDYKMPTAFDAVVACAKQGYLVSTIVAKSSLDIAWNRNTGLFTLIDTENSQIIYPVSGEAEEDTVEVDDRVNFFVFRSELPDPKKAPEDVDYSVFAGDGWEETDVAVNGVGFDTGYHTIIKTVSYTNTLPTGESGDITARDILIRTGTFGTSLTVEGYLNGGEGDTVTHYGFAGLVNVKKVATASYDEAGVVGRLSATDAGAMGHIKILDGATVYQIEQLGGANTSVSVSAGATVYDINHVKVEGAVENSTDRFTTKTGRNTDVDGASIGERITANNCNHTYTEDVVDVCHVYEVCKTCGYTLIKVANTVNGVTTVQKFTVEDGNNNVIIPKATYADEQITKLNQANGEVLLHGGIDTVPAIEQTPEIDQDAIDLTCNHNWQFVSDNNGRHSYKCGKCGSVAYTEECTMNDAHKCEKCGFVCRHTQYNETTKRLYYNCPICDVEFGTEEIPYYLSKAEHVEAFVKLYDWEGYPGYYMAYRADSDGDTVGLYAQLENDIDCSTINWPTGYSQGYEVIINGNNHTLSNMKYSGSASTGGYFFYNIYGCTLNNLNFTGCTLKGLWYTNKTAAAVKNVSFTNCVFSENVFGKYLYYNADFDNVGMTDCVMNSFILYPFYQDELASYKNLKFKNCEFKTTTFDYMYDSYITLENCEYDNCKTNGCALVCYGGYSSYGLKSGAELINVDINNSKSYGGAFVYYGGSKNYPFDFLNCNVTNTELYGGNGMALGGFVGNASTSTITFNKCSFDGYIESSSQVAAGFIGQAKTDTLTIKNCTVSANTKIVNKDTGGVAPFVGNGDSYNSNNNKFMGTLSAGAKSRVNYNGFSEEQVLFALYSSQIKTDDFTIDTATGKVTYIGNKNFTKLVLNNVIIAFDNIRDNVGGYSWSIQGIEVDGVSNGTVVGNLLLVDNYVQIVDEDSKDIIGASVTDDSIINGLTQLMPKYNLYYKNGTLIYDTRSQYNGKPLYVYAGTQNVGAFPTVGHGTVLVQVFDGDEMVGSVNIMNYQFKMGIE